MVGWIRSPARLLGALAVGYCLCLLLGGWLRHQTDPASYPLGQVSTYRPGLHVYRTWFDWSPMSTGDFRPIVVAAEGRKADPDYAMYRPDELKAQLASFVYTPFTALVLSPLVGTEDDRAQVYATIGILHHLLGLVALWFLFQVLCAGRPPRLRLGVPYLLCCLLFYPLAKTWALTQAGIWIFFLLATSAFLLHRGRYFGAGLALALGASIKPHLVVIPLVLACVRGMPRRLLGACALGLIATTLASLLYAGWDNCTDYVFRALPTLSAGYAYYPNQSFNGLLLRLFTEHDPAVFNLATPIPWIKVVATTLGLTLLVVTARTARRSCDGSQREQVLRVFAVTTAAAILASPVCWYHHYVTLAIPLVVAARTLLEARPATSSGPGWLLLSGGLLLSFHFETQGLGNGAWALLSGVSLYGALLVWAVGLSLLSNPDHKATSTTRAGSLP